MFGKVVIKDNVYIGCNSILMPGVTIASNTLIAAGSVVTRSTQSGTVVGGNPAKMICTLSDFVERNKKYNVGTFGMNINQKKKILENISDKMLICK